MLTQKLVPLFFFKDLNRLDRESRHFGDGFDVYVVPEEGERGCAIASIASLKLSYGVSLGQPPGKPLGKSLGKAFRKDRSVDAGFPQGACL
jgi:hypothetical protein